MQIDREPPRPSSHNPGLSADLEQVILRCLAKKPEDRFQSVEELLAQGPASGSPHRGRLLCPRCGDANPSSFRYCKACGQSLHSARRQAPRWHVPRPAEEAGLAACFSACLVGAVATCGAVPLLPELRDLLELTAVLATRGDLAQFRQRLARSGRGPLADPWSGQLLALPMGLRHFTNRSKMRSAMRDLLAGTSREQLIASSLVGEVLSLLARQRSRPEAAAVTLRSLLELLQERLSKAFASERWLLLSLETLEDAVESPLTSQNFENAYSGQPALLALHVLFSSSVPAPAGLEEMLSLLATDRQDAEPWRRTAAALIGGLWAFWHGVEALPHALLRRQPAASLAYDLGRSLAGGCS
jgi:hypothetical protein